MKANAVISITPTTNPTYRLYEFVLPAQIITGNGKTYITFDADSESGPVKVSVEVGSRTVAIEKR